MKKIGIITLSASDNCGSLLQAYALQYVIEQNMGYQAEMINYECRKSKKLYSIFKPGLLKHPGRLIKTIRRYPLLRGQKLDYSLFRDKYLNSSAEKYHDPSELSAIANNYDAIVCGSDQIWNVDMYDFDAAYFLGWAGDVPKIAYAASLGGQEKIEAKPELRELKKTIESFQDISVREGQGKNTLNLFVDKEIEVCADPTLIMPRKRWYEMTEDRMVKDDYIFYYSYNYASHELNEVVRKAAAIYKMPVYVINASRWVEKAPDYYGFRLYDKGGPEAFLNLMRHAKYAFVESLHGTIFAYIYRRNFWFLNNRIEDALDHRSEFILNAMDLRDRTVRPNSFDSIDFQKNIDYEHLSSKMDYWIEKSYGFLKESLIKIGNNDK